MEIKKANKILIQMLDILPSGRFKGLYPLNSVNRLPASKKEIKEAIKTIILNYKANKKLTPDKKYKITKTYVALASFIPQKDFELVGKVNLKLGHLYTDNNEEVLAWFSEPKNRQEHDRTGVISTNVMLEAKKLEQEVGTWLN